MTTRSPLATLLLVVTVLLAGCATGTVQKAQSGARVPPGARVLLLPPHVVLSELTAGGVLEPRADWTASAERLVVVALTDHLRGKNLELVPYRESGAADDLRQQQLRKVHGLVGRAILTHVYNPQLRLPSKQGRFDWTLGEEARSLTDGHGDTQYALFTEFADAYASAGRIALNVAAAIIGGPIRHGRQECLASLVDLRTGEIVWFNYFIDPSGDLRTAEPVQRAVQRLLAELPL